MMPRVEPGSVDTRRWTLIAVCVTTFMLLLDITIVNVALPSIQRRLSADLTGLQWVVDAYALVLAALILTAGALADRFGRHLLSSRITPRLPRRC
jgi:MFS family permease